MESRFFGDSYVSYTADDLFFGFYNEAADKLNGGNYYNGDDYSLRNHTTPIFHDIQGLGNQTQYGMYTGANDIGSIGYLRIINNVAAINKLQTVWNGYNYTNTTVKRPIGGETGLTLNDIALKEVSYGMQFPPGLE